MNQKYLFRNLKKTGPAILTFISVAGIIGTSILVANEAPIASKRTNDYKKKNKEVSSIDLVKINLPIYAPAIIVGGSTILCILGINVLNKKNQASITTAYAVVSSSFKEYRKKILELYGEEVDEQILETITRYKCDYHQINRPTYDGVLLFYEAYSDQFFERTEKEVMDAEYHMNRNFAIFGYVSLNDFLTMLGLPETEYGNDIGWNIADGYLWIDFEHEEREKPDGTIYYKIEMAFGPGEVE